MEYKYDKEKKDYCNKLHDSRLAYCNKKFAEGFINDKSLILTGTYVESFTECLDNHLQDYLICIGYLKDKDPLRYKR